MNTASLLHSVNITSRRNRLHYKEQCVVDVQVLYLCKKHIVCQSQPSGNDIK